VGLALWLVIDGSPVIPALITTLIPVVLVCYLITPAGRQALTQRSVAVTWSIGFIRRQMSSQALLFRWPL